MLTASQFDDLVTAILELYEEFHTSVLVDIARRLANLDFSSAAWQVQRLNESGMVYREILEKLSKLTGQSKWRLRRTFSKAGVQAMRFDDKIYKAAGMDPLPLNLSPAMLRVLEENIRKTSNIMQNLTLTTAITGENAFIDAADLAYMQVSSGSMSYNQAIVEGVKKLVDDGIKVIGFPSGRNDQVDVAMRRAVLTGVGQLSGALQLARAEEMGTDLVQTSMHIGARNVGEGPANHESWQGKVFSISGKDPNYPNFRDVTGYGTGEGLQGYNCRHSFYPFFPGISEEIYSEAERQDYGNAKVKLNGENVSVYEATQRQREIERKIRYWKRRKQAIEAAEFDDPGTLAELEKAGGKVREWQAKMREFVEETGLKRQRIREQVY